ncbi:response regulator [Paenibacillus glycanilyticus]|uniref:Transcriptional regulatory protein YxjL n=1 Tax=Paenibacillus glycanilyticus TaxID=126569 RepID=A0ABQ6GJ38_9BACL|nr:response regulator transcription factor [Paenibacillus glycanilyticus]GLX69647.1 putative transcriptional regulatory protein YxjL [Paenibacillus glycanilyticus]
MSVDTIRVAIVDDQLLVRHGFKFMINAQLDMEVVGEASNGREAVALAVSARPHVFLMDVQMPEYNGIEATRDIMAAWPDCKIIILTTFDTEDYVFQGIRSGAIGYLLKDTTPEELIEAIRAAYRGEAIFRTAIASKAMSRVVRSARANAADNDLSHSMGESFTEREHEVLQQMAYGLRNEEIAAKLYIGESTVKTHVHRILQKLGVEDRTQAVVFAIRNRIVQ